MGYPPDVADNETPFLQHVSVEAGASRNKYVLGFTSVEANAPLCVMGHWGLRVRT